jgi:hypothetical protein
MGGQVGYWGTLSSSHSDSTETRSETAPQTALHNPGRSTAYPTSAGTAGPLAMLHNISQAPCAAPRTPSQGHHAPPRRSTAHPTDAYTAKPLAILRHTLLVHRVLPCTRYCERYHKPRHSLPAHAWVTSKTSTCTPTRTARGRTRSRSGVVFRLRARQPGSIRTRSIREREQRSCDVHLNLSSPTSSSEQRVGCLMYREGEWLAQCQ